MGRTHAIEMRSAVLAALIAGQTPNQAAEMFDLPQATVRTWQRKAGLVPKDERGRLAALRPKKATEDIGELVAAYLQENLTTLRVQQQHFRDKDWLAGQNAADLAMLHGVTADKAFRILEAIQASAEYAAAHASPPDEPEEWRDSQAGE